MTHLSLCLVHVGSQYLGVGEQPEMVDGQCDIDTVLTRAQLSFRE